MILFVNKIAQTFAGGIYSVTPGNYDGLTVQGESLLSGTSDNTRNDPCYKDHSAFIYNENISWQQYVQVVQISTARLFWRIECAPKISLSRRRLGG